MNTQDIRTSSESAINVAVIGEEQPLSGTFPESEVWPLKRMKQEKKKQKLIMLLTGVLVSLLLLIIAVLIYTVLNPSYTEDENGVRHYYTSAYYSPPDDKRVGFPTQPMELGVEKLKPVTRQFRQLPKQGAPTSPDKIETVDLVFAAYNNLEAIKKFMNLVIWKLEAQKPKNEPNKEIKYRLFIYEKSPTFIDNPKVYKKLLDMNLGVKKEQLEVYVEHMENMGREQHTFAHHCVKNYDEKNFGDIVLFIPGSLKRWQRVPFLKHYLNFDFKCQAIPHKLEVVSWSRKFNPEDITTLAPHHTFDDHHRLSTLNDIDDYCHWWPYEGRWQDLVDPRNLKLFALHHLGRWEPNFPELRTGLLKTAGHLILENPKEVYEAVLHVTGSKEPESGHYMERLMHLTYCGKSMNYNVKSRVEQSYDFEKFPSAVPYTKEDLIYNDLESPPQENILYDKRRNKVGACLVASEELKKEEWKFAHEELEDEMAKRQADADL